MNSQLHLAIGLVQSRAFSDQDQSILREVTLARQAKRRTRQRRSLFSR